MRQSTDPRLAATPKLLIRIKSEFGTPTMLSHQLLGLDRAGFSDVTVMVADDELLAAGKEIAAHVQDVAPPGLHLKVASRPFDRHTAGMAYEGSLVAVSPLVLIMPGDTLLPYEELRAATQYHALHDSPMTWVVTTNPGPRAQNAGRLLVDVGGQMIRHALEHRQDVDPVDYLAGDLFQATSIGVVIADRDFFCGFYEQHESALQDSPYGRDLYRELIPRVIESGSAVHVYDVGVPAPDLGTPDRLHEFASPLRATRHALGAQGSNLSELSQDIVGKSVEGQ